jgi:tetratricopeptide (TPR) repeat protein
MGKAEQACADYKKAIECDPENAEAFGQLGSILGIMLREGRERDEAVLPYLQRALELQPTKPSSYLRFAWFYAGPVPGRPKEAAAAWRKAAELAPPGSAEAYIYLASAASADGDHRAVRENLEKALAIDPSNPEAYLGLGEAHSALGEHQQAVAALTKALESPRAPNHVLFHIYRVRGGIYDLQDNYAAALSDYDRAIEMCAYQWWLYKRRGRAHFYLKHYQQALADIAKGLEHEPDELSNLIWIPPEDLASCPDEKFRTGMRALADKTIEILEKRPNVSEDTKAKAYYTRAAIYLSTGKLDQADRLLRDLRERQQRGTSKSAEAAGGLAVLGNLLLKQQQYAAAEPFLRECLAIREQKMPDDWLRYNSLSMLGGALLGQKKYADAEPLLLQGYEGMKQRETKIPGHYRVVRLAEAAERLVRLYEATNQPEKARTWREKLPNGKEPGS